MSDNSFSLDDSVPGTPEEVETGSVSDSDSDDFQTPFNKTTKVTKSRKSLTNKIEESIQESDEEEDVEDEEFTEDEDEVDRQVKTKQHNLQESYQIPVSSKARKVAEESYMSDDQSLERSESVAEEEEGEEEEEENDSPLQLSHSQLESLTARGKNSKSVVHFGSEEEERSDDGQQKSTLGKRIKTPGRKNRVPSSEESSEDESAESDSSPVKPTKSKIKNKKPPVKSEENSEDESDQSEDPSPVKPLKSKIKSKKPPVESSEEEQESFQVAKSKSIQRSNKRQPKALVSSDEDEEPPQQAQSSKKRESLVEATPSFQSHSRDDSSSESCGKAVTPDSEEEADCFEATIPNSSPIVQHIGRPKTPVFDISIKESEAEESYHVKRSIDLDTSDEMDQGEEETEQSYHLLKASKQLKKNLVSEVKTEAEDSPLKPPGKRTGKMVIHSSTENSAATSEAEASASMESSVDSARSPSPDSSYPKSNKKKSVKPSRKALQTSSSEGTESSFEKPKSTKGAKPAHNIESDDTEEDSFNHQVTPATLVKQTKRIDSDGTEDESSGYNSRHQNQSSSHVSQTLHQMLKTSMERQDSGNDSGMEQLSLKQQEELTSFATSAQNKNTSSSKIDSVKPKTATKNVQEITLSDSPMNYRQKVETVEDSSDSVQEVSDDSFEEHPTSLLEKTRARSPVPPPAVIPKARQDLAPKQDMEMGIAKPLRVTEAEIQKVRQDLEATNLIIRSSRLSELPDGGNKLTTKSRMLKKQLEEMEAIRNSQLPEPAKPAYGHTMPTYSEAELRIQLQKKKWALDSAVGEVKDRLRTEVRDIESQLLKINLAEATSSGSSDKIKILPNAGMSGGMAEMRKRVLADQPPQQPGGIKYLAQPEKLSEIQKRMLDDQPGKDIYQRTAGGHITAASKREAQSVTLDSIENLHRSLASCPEEHEIEETPSQINIPLMPHQQRALKWLIWRETQNPPGGILADDMGLGKTLTMISLILRQKELDPPPPAHHDLWLSKTVKIKRSDGTLVVCPASVVGQWETEIKRRCKRNALSVVSYHGQDRHKMASTLHKYGVVITTFQTLAREIMPNPGDKKADSMPIGDFDPEGDRDQFRQSVLTQIGFNRVILDEGHVIRNPKSGVSQSVCRLRANRRWIVTGTPVQNKELDMYSLLRFLRVRPFDQLEIWKRWVDSSKNKATEHAMDRLKLLVKALLLRRTKDQKMEGSAAPLVEMPARELHTHKVVLSEDEMKVYAKLQEFASTKLKAYLKQQEQKLRDEFLHGGRMPDEPSHKQGKVTKMQMLTLLLRLRQVCCHPALLKNMLDQNDGGEIDAEVDDDDDEDKDSIDLIGQLAKIKLDGGVEGEENDEEDDKKFFSVSNPIFDSEKKSSKMTYIIEEVGKVVAQKHKAVVVSQWTSYLNVFSQHFYRMNIRTHKIDGSVPVKMRTQIVEDFNTNPRGPPVMLLSLGAGGVGLNLIGGNHLFLADLHWNPQLEAQACDRIYRVGQKKDVHVHRMITEGTVEERILMLQQQKLALANGILTGTATKAVKSLTIDDLKMLFNPQPPVRSAPVQGAVAGAPGFSGIAATKY